jgi:hypothetical protein
VCWGASTCDPRNLRVSRLSTVTPVVVGRYRAHLMQVNRKGSVVIGPLLLIVIVVGVAIFWMRQTRMSGSRSHEPTTRAVTVQVEPPSLRAERSNPCFRRAEPFRLADDLGEIDGLAALAMTVADSIRSVTALARF